MTKAQPEVRQFVMPLLHVNGHARQVEATLRFLLRSIVHQLIVRISSMGSDMMYMKMFRRQTVLQCLKHSPQESIRQVELSDIQCAHGLPGCGL